MLVPWDPILAHFLLSGGIALTESELLEKYQKLLGEIEETENQLRTELAAALAHHFTGMEANDA